MLRLSTKHISSLVSVLLGVTCRGCRAGSIVIRRLPSSRRLIAYACCSLTGRSNHAMRWLMPPRYSPHSWSTIFQRRGWRWCDCTFCSNLTTASAASECGIAPKVSRLAPWSKRCAGNLMHGFCTTRRRVVSYRYGCRLNSSLLIRGVSRHCGAASATVIVTRNGQCGVWPT